MGRGVGISFEGISNAGKSSSIAYLRKALVSRGCHIEVKEDLLNYQGDSIGLQIKRILDVGAPTFRLGFPLTETYLILAKRAFESQTRLRPAMDNGAILLLDRDVDTVCAYQILVLKGERTGLDVAGLVSWIRESNRLAGVEPALTILLDVSVDNAVKREREKQRLLRLPFAKSDEAAFRKHHDPLVASYAEVLEVPLPGRDVVRIDTNGIYLEAVCRDVSWTVTKWLRERGTI